MNKMVLYIDVLCVCVKMVITCKCDCGLIVGQERNRMLGGAEEFVNEQVKPDGFLLACMRATYSASVGERGMSS